jgi:Spy/CpxP family protein refolding chaperone
MSLQPQLLHLLTPTPHILCLNSQYQKLKEIFRMKRILFAAVAVVSLTVALVAQRGPGGPGAPRDPSGALKNALGLTDAQVESIKALAQAEQPNMRSIQTDIEQKRQALDSLLSAASPNVMEVGNAAIALRGAQNRLEAERTAFIGQVKQQLTGDQQQKLDMMLAENGGRGLPLFGFEGRGGFGGPGGPRGRGR